MPEMERSRILQAQVEWAAAEYEADIVRPIAYLELTVFTALDESFSWEGAIR